MPSGADRHAFATELRFHKNQVKVTQWKTSAKFDDDSKDFWIKKLVLSSSLRKEVKFKMNKNPVTNWKGFKLKLDFLQYCLIT